MTDKLHCPFCEAELRTSMLDEPVAWYCPNRCIGTYEPKVWRALITGEKAKQDLEIAKSYVKGISEMVINSGDNMYIVIGHFKKLAEQTLEQIEHKGQK